MIDRNKLHGELVKIVGCVILHKENESAQIDVEDVLDKYMGNSTIDHPQLIEANKFKCQVDAVVSQIQQAIGECETNNLKVLENESKS
jgi:hypothetical protein